MPNCLKWWVHAFMLYCQIKPKNVRLARRWGQKKNPPPRKLAYNRVFRISYAKKYTGYCIIACVPIWLKIAILTK